MSNLGRPPIDPDVAAKGAPVDASNPYAPPAERGPDGFNPYAPTAHQGSNLANILAGSAALLAAGFWAVTSLIYGGAAANGQLSPAQVIMPVFLVGIYIWRGIQIFKGNAAAIRRILFLHILGAVLAVVQIVSTKSEFIQTLYSVKIAIHVFGAITGYFAGQALKRPPTYPPH